MEDLKSCKKIAIIGSPGSGKSTLATSLSKQLNLPVYHLDLYQWEAGWVKRDKQKFIADHQEICLRDRWIIDGCGVRLLLAVRVQHADAVIFLDIPRLVCIWRIIKRWWQTRNIDRIDVPEGCRDRLSWQLFVYVWKFPAQLRAHIMEQLNEPRGKKPIIILSSAREVADFLRGSKD